MLDLNMQKAYMDGRLVLPEASYDGNHWDTAYRLFQKTGGHLRALGNFLYSRNALPWLAEYLQDWRNHFDWKKVWRLRHPAKFVFRLWDEAQKIVGKGKTIVEKRILHF
eukprot:15469455-Alexandrium_andersonii.AAC.1